MNNEDKMFGTIFLLTDGQNNVEDTIWNNMMIINRTISKGLVVNTIAYGTGADDKLETFALRSGGIFSFANTNLSYTDLMNVFAVRPFCENMGDSSVKVRL